MTAYQTRQTTLSIGACHGLDRTNRSAILASPLPRRRRTHWLIAGGAPEIAQARRLGRHLPNRVTEVYSHVAPEVELRLLNDLQRRWHEADLNVRAHPTAPEPAERHVSGPLAA